ncbi:MAG: hypothetical protein IIT78_02575 [Mycoplasmataceae bacterium]|nr:hypothetical protein [Mycoplasmataceae bacterium]
MANFKFTEHSIPRFKQRGKNKQQTDLFDTYSELEKLKRDAILCYVSHDQITQYYEVPGHKDLYFVVNKISNVCVTIKTLTYKQKLELDYPKNS